MKTLIELAAKKSVYLARKIKKQPAIVGYVEQLDFTHIAGWVLNRDEGSINLTLQVNGSIYQLVPRWIERADVSQQYGVKHLNSGFLCELPVHVVKALEKSASENEEVCIYANDIPLVISCSQLQAVAKLEQETLGLKSSVTMDIEDNPPLAHIPSSNQVTKELDKETLLKSAIELGEESLGLKVGVALDIESSASSAHVRLPHQVEKLKQQETLNRGVDAKPGGNVPDLLLEESMVGEVESWGHFVMHGWVIRQGEAVENFQLLCNGAKFDCSVVRTARPDVIAIPGDNTDINKIGYEIELPGYIWDLAEGDGDLEISLLAGGEALNDEPLILSRSKAIEWISQISASKEGKKKQFMSLLALEHLRYSDLFEALASRTQQYYNDFAQKMQLNDFLGGKGGGAALAQVDVEDANTLILWKALGELNKRLANERKTVFEHVSATQKKMRLTSVVKENFHKSVIPLLCQHEQFIQMRQLMDFSTLYPLENEKHASSMSLALAPIIADGLVNRATNLLWRLSKQLDNGWLNTECVHFSVRHLQQMEQRGEVDLHVAERFRYAVIGLLGGFNSEWFSRLHDQELVDAMIAFVTGSDCYTDYHRRDVIDAAIRFYGMDPVFWQRLAEAEVELRNNELIIAKGYWQSLYAALTNVDTPLSGRLDKIQVPLRYFREKGNLESIIFTREIIANTLPEINKKLSPVGLELIQSLLSSNPDEATRLAAFPLLDKNRIQGKFPEMQEQLYNVLRRIIERPASVVYQIQKESAACLKRVNNPVIDDAPALLEALETLRAKAIGLSNWESMFLGVELLVQGLREADRAGEIIEPWLMRLDDVMKKVIAESKDDFYLPPPVCAALNCLVAMKAGPLLQAWLRQMRNCIESKFGSLHDVLFDEPLSKQVIALELERGWPQDTLVVIYSCKKYLSDRVTAIRQTWVKELIARDIPYVVLVGDGNDTLQGDVLALNVSDNYESLPQKSLRMFEWVYNNTNAQYVFKIDDDCYLDVAEYFDSLSYRKHYYYGRVLKREIGAMDRAWHHEKSQTLRAKKAIDKSPEPSVYADGGGGYSLSRIAIGELIKAEKTEEGQRLIASSFMEDKLVGDLLALVHIAPSNEDYECYQRRRTFGDAMPIAMWENIFYPSQITPTKVVHLDTHLQQKSTSLTKNTKELWPKKLWPTCWLPSIAWNSNQLELLTSLDQFARLVQNGIFVVSVVRNEMTMLPHFLAHYRQLGVTSFIFVDNCSDDGTREYLNDQSDVILYSSDTEYKCSHFGVAWQQAILGNLCINKWVLLVDADELLVYEGFEQKPLFQLLEEIGAKGKNAVRTDMVDMYPYGDLAEADFSTGSPFEVAGWFDKAPLKNWRLGSGWFSNRNNWSSSLRHRLAPNSEPNAYVSQKYALFKYFPWIRLSQGLHYQTGMVECESPVHLAHFKYHAGFKAKVMAEVKRKQHYNDASEYRQYMTILAEGGGGFGSSKISVEYKNSRSFRQLK